MMIEYLNELYIWTPRFEGEPTGGEPQGGTGEPQGGTGEPQGGASKTFTQEDLNRILAKERRDHEGKMTSMSEELDALKSKANLTAEDRTSLESRLEEIKNRSATNEQKLQSEIKKLNKRYDTDIESARAEAAQWQQKFTQDRITTSLTQAAVVGDAFNPEQVVALLTPQTSLVNVLDDEGNPTGQFDVTIKQPGKNKQGEQVVFERTPDEVIKAMREDEGFFNLFKGSGVGGAGSISRPGQQQTTPSDPAEYIKQRREGTLKI
jgi:hypothetical protein